MARTFYRVCQSNPPTRSDFVPAKILKPERPPPRDPKLRELWETGVSVFVMERQARNKVRQYPFLGSFIARLDIADEAPVSVEKTLGAGHFTLRGDPDAMLACVVSVVPV